MDADIIVSFLVGACLAGFIGFAAGDTSATSEMQRAAVHRNLGTYDADGKFAWTVERKE